MKKDQRSLSSLLIVGILVLASNSAVSAQRTARPATPAASLTIITEPNAIVWVDEIRRGTTDARGKLTVTKVGAGRHTLRVRANGFKEATMPLAAGRRGSISVN